RHADVELIEARPVQCARSDDVHSRNRQSAGQGPPKRRCNLSTAYDPVCRQAFTRDAWKILPNCGLALKRSGKLDIQSRNRVAGEPFDLGEERRLKVTKFPGLAYSVDRQNFRGFLDDVAVVCRLPAGGQTPDEHNAVE